MNDTTTASEAAAMRDAVPFLSAVEESHPSGPNLEYDADFLALERAQRGRSEQVIGDAVKPGEEPDWADVLTRAEALLARTRDLRVVASLTTAWVHTQGFAGLAAGLAIVRGLLESQWDTVHPQLDPDDDHDPTMRVNTLAIFAAADGLLKPLRALPIVSSKTLGRFSLRDLRVASGRAGFAGGAAADAAQQTQIDAAFRDADPAVLGSTLAAVTGALDQLAAIDRTLLERIGDRAPDLKPLAVDLSEIRGVMSAKLAARGIATAAAGGVEAAPAGAVPAAAGGGDVTSRADVARTLDRLCEYYRVHEPSSPIPLLLQRAKRLVDKDFLSILRDLAPSGVAEAESLGGVEKGSE